MPVTQQYWRIFVNGPPNGAGTNVVAIAEVVFLDTNNAPISLSGGTASASSVFSGSFVAANAFDGNPSTAWASLATPSSGSPQWLQYQFTGAVPVVVISIAVRNDSAWTIQSPPTFLIQSSPDGTTWTTQNTVTGFNWTSQGQTAYFAASTVVGHARASQVAVEVMKTGANARASQITVETIINPSAHVKASQVAVEAMVNAMAHVKLSQIAVEIMFPYVAPIAVPIQNFLLP
jgi:hypothetical protein